MLVGPQPSAPPEHILRFHQEHERSRQQIEPYEPHFGRIGRHSTVRIVRFFSHRKSAAQQRREHRAERELRLLLHEEPLKSLRGRRAQLRFGDFRDAERARDQKAALGARKGQHGQRDARGVSSEEEAVLAAPPVEQGRVLLELLERSEESAAVILVFREKNAERDDEVGKRRDRNVEETLPRNEAEDGEEAGAVGESDGEKRGRKNAGLLDCRAFEAMIGI